MQREAATSAKQPSNGEAPVGAFVIRRHQHRVKAVVTSVVNAKQKPWRCFYHCCLLHTTIFLQMTIQGGPKKLAPYIQFIVVKLTKTLYRTKTSYRTEKTSLLICTLTNMCCIYCFKETHDSVIYILVMFNYQYFDSISI